MIEGMAEWRVGGVGRGCKDTTTPQGEGKRSAEIIKREESRMEMRRKVREANVK